MTTVIAILALTTALSIAASVMLIHTQRDLLDTIRSLSDQLYTLKVRGAQAPPAGASQSTPIEPLPSEVQRALDRYPTDAKGSTMRWIREARRNGKPWPEIYQRIAGPGPLDDAPPPVGEGARE